MARDAVSEIRERLDVVDLIQGYVPSLKKTGANFKGLCPFHNEKTPSFIVFPDSQNFHCFGCGKGGDIFTFYMDIENVDFREALKELASRAGVELEHSGSRPPEEDERHKRLIEINELAAMWFNHILKTSSQGAAGRDVIKSRGISPEMVDRFRLGFAPDSWDMLLNFLSSRNISPGLAAEAGLASERDRGGYFDRFRGRVMFPIRNRDGQTVGFGGRALGEAIPKYLNTAQTPIFDKSALVYALDLAKDAIREHDEVVIVEGYMDAITAHQFGYANVVASMGTALTESQVSQIKRGSSRIVLALDSDAAGQMATLRGLGTLTENLDADVRPVISANGLLDFQRKLKADISIVQLEGGKDPDEIIRTDPAAWPAIVERARPFMDFTIDLLTRDIDLGDARAKSEAVKQLVPLLRQIPDTVTENHYTRLIARRLDINEQAIIAEKRTALSGRSSPSRHIPRVDSTQRPRRNSREDYFVALLLTYHELNAEVPSQVNLDVIEDPRNREIITILRDPDTFGLQGETLVAAFPDDLADHAEQLLATMGDRPEQFPSRVLSETRDVLRGLGERRYAFLLLQLQNGLREAVREGDEEGRREMLAQLQELILRKSDYDPVPSPYFKDTRSKST